MVISYLIFLAQYYDDFPQQVKGCNGETLHVYLIHHSLLLQFILDWLGVFNNPVWFLRGRRVLSSFTNSEEHYYNF